MTSTVEQNLLAVLAEIASAAPAWGRDPRDISLVAVSKVFTANHIEPALVAGHRLFGENKVQEALDKWPALKQRYPLTKLHLIGPLQTNKVGKAFEVFDLIETLDRPKLARAIANQMEKTGRKMPCFVQVNTGEEPQKAGISPTEADDFIKQCRADFQIDVQGVMAIPPAGVEPGPHFALLKKIADRNGLACCSMGMSADYPIAIQFGATHVRVGSGIFGQRPAPKLSQTN